MKDYIKKKFFTNRGIETILITLGYFIPLMYKFYPSNTHYLRGTIRSVKRDGLFFKLDIADYQEYLIYFNLKTDSSKGVVKHLSPDKGLILDIGANIGQTSLWIAKYIKSDLVNIIAFEPYPSTYSKLKYNLSLNNNFKNISAENIALGNSNSKLYMTDCGSSNSGGFTVNSVKINNDVVEVLQTTIDSYFKNNEQRINFIKIDVEGFEYQVLLGGEQTIKKDYPILFIELDNNNLKAHGSAAIDLLILLKNYGYNSILNAETLLEIGKQELENCHLDIVCKKI